MTVYITDPHPLIVQLYMLRVGAASWLTLLVGRIRKRLGEKKGKILPVIASIATIMIVGLILSTYIFLPLT